VNVTKIIVLTALHQTLSGCWYLDGEKIYCPRAPLYAWMQADRASSRSNDAERCSVRFGRSACNAGVRQ